MGSWAQLVRSNPALGVRDERIPGAFFLDGEESFVGFGGPRAIQSFACAALIIINGGEQVIAGDVIEKNGSGLAAPLQANIKLRGGLGESAGIEIGTAHSKMSEPGIRKLLRFLKGMQRVTSIALFELRFAGNQLGMNLRLGFQALGKRRDELQPLGFLSGGNVDLSRTIKDARVFTVGGCLCCRGNGFLGLAKRQLCEG